MNNNRKHCQAAALMLLMAMTAQAQQPLTERYAERLTPPRGYVCPHRTDSIVVDGKADEASWRLAPYTETFVDISGGNHPLPSQATRAKMLWDENYFYVYAEMDERHVWANITQRDAVIFYDNDFEVFIDPQGTGHNYFEIETNARGVVFDLSLTSAYRDPHRPFVQFQWNCPGLKLATQVQGTLNNPADTDKGWTVEMAIPRQAIASEWDNYLQANRRLRVNFSRVEWQHSESQGRYDRKKGADGKYLPEDNWVWTPTGQVAMHMPERWGYVLLAPEGADISTLDPMAGDDGVRRFLWMLFYAQEDRWNTAHSYYTKVEEMGLQKADWALLPEGYTVMVETTRRTYQITATSPKGETWVIDQTGYCYQEPMKQK